VRHQLTFPCAGASLAGSLDEAVGGTGILMVTGGTQTRVGSHRMYERLAAGLAQAGHPCFRFDRRGVGDSEGAEPGFRGSRDDLVAAAEAFRNNAKLERIVGFGLCDGATALMMFGGEIGFDGLVLVNPWLVEAEAGQPPPAAIRQRYRERLVSGEAWRRLLTGRIDLRKAARGLRRATGTRRSGLGAEATESLSRSRIPVRIVLARSDATAIAAEPIWRARACPNRSYRNRLAYVCTAGRCGCAAHGPRQAVESVTAPQQRSG
jgi:exosortase A-associated hydrolase 1